MAVDSAADSYPCSSHKQFVDAGKHGQQAGNANRAPVKDAAGMGDIKKADIAPGQTASAARAAHSQVAATAAGHAAKHTAARNAAGYAAIHAAACHPCAAAVNA